MESRGEAAMPAAKRDAAGRASADGLEDARASEPRLIQIADLPGSDRSRRFEGHTVGEVGVSFFVTDAAASHGPSLHTHPYAEVFVVEEGRVAFTVGDAKIEAAAGQVVVVPAGIPHKFVNLGPGRSRHLDIHASGTMQSEWLED
jgi:mannose-6-phosphate isomerase-like protein (cupin superfamily)